MAADMNMVYERIYVGGLAAATNSGALLEHNVTHVLTVHSDDLEPGDKSDRITYKFVRAFDIPQEDLLTKFAECFQFMDKALQDGRGSVLVHCLVGMSRSATVVIAYLMHKHNMTADEALAAVKQHRFIIKPNCGFMEQLEFFERRMDCNLDLENRLYRQYRLSLLADQAQSGEMDGVTFQPNPTPLQTKLETYYKCRKCRQALFRQASIMSHAIGEGDAAFDWRSKVPANQRPAKQLLDQSEGTICDKSLFIEPVQWMKDCIIGQVEGKILCPKCQAKLGSFIWHVSNCLPTAEALGSLRGERCPCGAWVAPAFHIQRSKVDECKPRPVEVINQSSLNNNPVQPNADQSELCEERSCRGQSSVGPIG